MSLRRWLGWKLLGADPWWVRAHIRGVENGIDHIDAGLAADGARANARMLREELGIPEEGDRRGQVPTTALLALVGTIAALGLATWGILSLGGGL